MLLGGADDDDGRLDVRIRTVPLALVHHHDCCGCVSLRPYYRSDGLLAAMGDRDVYPVGQSDRALDTCIHRVAPRQGRRSAKSVTSNLTEAPGRTSTL